MANNEETPADAARRVLIEQRIASEKACREGIKELLEKYECKLDVEVTLKEGSITPRVTVVSK